MDPKVPINVGGNMDIIKAIWEFVATNWVQIGVALWLLEQGLRILSKITPWSWDDNLVDVIAKVLESVFPKKVTS